MAFKNQIYKCEICGLVIEVLHQADGVMSCCGELMEIVEEKNKQQQGFEKHIPIIEQKNSKIFVKVGSIPHPMEEKHYIEFIELIANGKVYRKSLEPGEKPEAEFCATGKEIIARAYCNVHGLWKN